MDSRLTARNNQFIANCLEIIEKNHNISLHNAVRLALKTKPDSYYVSFEQAKCAINRLKYSRKYKSTVSDKPNIRQWYEIEARILTRLASTHHESYNNALLHVINNMKPSQFFISEDRALRLVRPFVNRSYQLKIKNR